MAITAPMACGSLDTLKRVIRPNLCYRSRGLAIFNPAVGGWSRGEGVKNIWRPALEGLTKSTFLLRG